MNALENLIGPTAPSIERALSASKGGACPGPDHSPVGVHTALRERGASRGLRSPALGLKFASTTADSLRMFFVWMGFALFALISSAVGLRLVLMWRRTRQLPELLIGIGVLGIGPVGFGFLTLGMGLAEAGIPGAPLAAAIGSAACLAGASAKFLFNSKVYRPQSRIVDRAVKAILVTSALLYVVHLGAYGFANGREHPVWYVLRGWLQVGCLLWGAAEAFVYYGRMRRRVALQLADGLTANRFMLWGIAAGSAGLGTLFGIVAVMIGGQQIIMHPAILASSSVFGSVSAVAMGLAFFPPRALRAYFEAGERSAA